MEYKDIIRALESRKDKMSEILTNQKDSVPIEKQHQIYGAINELNVFLRTLEFCREKDMENKKSFDVKESSILKDAEKSRIINTFDK